MELWITRYKHFQVFIPLQQSKYLPLLITTTKLKRKQQKKNRWAYVKSQPDEKSQFVSLQSGRCYGGFFFRSFSGAGSSFTSYAWVCFYVVSMFLCCVSLWTLLLYNMCFSGRENTSPLPLWLPDCVKGCYRLRAGEISLEVVSLFFWGVPGHTGVWWKLFNLQHTVFKP